MVGGRAQASSGVGNHGSLSVVVHLDENKMLAHVPQCRDNDKLTGPRMCRNADDGKRSEAKDLGRPLRYESRPFSSCERETGILRIDQSNRLEIFVYRQLVRAFE
jgi:hypothetical protein